MKLSKIAFLFLISGEFLFGASGVAIVNSKSKVNMQKLDEASKNLVNDCINSSSNSCLNLDYLSVKLRDKGFGYNDKILSNSLKSAINLAKIQKAKKSAEITEKTKQKELNSVKLMAKKQVVTRSSNEKSGNEQYMIYNPDKKIQDLKDLSDNMIFSKSPIKNIPKASINIYIGTGMADKHKESDDFLIDFNTGGSKVDWGDEPINRPFGKKYRDQDEYNEDRIKDVVSDEEIEKNELYEKEYQKEHGDKDKSKKK